LGWIPEVPEWPWERRCLSYWQEVWIRFSHVIEADSDASYRFKEFPRWRNQKHPNQVMDIAFTDSSIPENISKVCSLVSVLFEWY
jgi:hypothetical protein